MSRLFAVVGRALPAALGAAAASCAQLAGIENTVAAGNSIAVTRMSIGSKVVLAPVDPAEISATYFVANDASGYDRVSAVPDPSHGRVTTKLRMPAPVEVTLGHGTTSIPRLFAFPGPQQSVLDVSETPATAPLDSLRFGNTLYGVLEHPGRQEAPMGATFSVDVTLDAAVGMGQVFQTYVVGAWLQRAFSGPEAPAVDAMQIGPLTFGFTAANSVSGRPAVDQITTDDVFLVLRYTGTALTGVAQAMPFAQSGAADAVTTPTLPVMVPVAPGPMSPTFTATVPQGALADRYKAVQPSVGAMPVVNMSWNLVAAPGYAVGSNAGPVLQSGTVAMDTGGVTTSYENPFAARGWNTIFTLATSVNRVFMPPIGSMGTPVAITLYAGMNQFLEPPQPMPATPVVLDLPAGLPQVITIGNTVLTADGAVIQKLDQFYHVSFTVEAPATPAPQGPRFYNLQLFDLTVDAMGLHRVLVFAAAGKDPAFALPPELFQVDHMYTLRAVSTLGGFPPGAEPGDFSHPQLPLAQAYLDSAVFTVVKP